MADRWNSLDVGVVVIYFGSMAIRLVEDGFWGDAYLDLFGTEDSGRDAKLWFKVRWVARPRETRRRRRPPPPPATAAAGPNPPQYLRPHPPYVRSPLPSLSP